jgi:arylsulfatase A-like enzyme
MRRDAFVEDWLRSRPSYALFERNHYRHLDTIPNLDYIADLYDAEVAYLDYEIGRLFSHLGELGVLDNTLVVLFGDHGENMTEHDAWFDHAGLYDSVTQVPLILWAPGTVPACEVTSLISMVDIKPTVLELLSLTPDLGMDGRSLMGLMHGKAENHRDVVYLSECTWQAKRGVRTNEWKYIRCTDPGVYPRTEPELYNVLDDPTEQQNLATQFPEVAAEMDTLLSSWLDEQLAGREDPMVGVVHAGLPAVRRLRGVIAEDAAEAAGAGTNGASSKEAVAHP